MVKNKLLKKIKKFFILPLFVVIVLCSFLVVNASGEYVEINGDYYHSSVKDSFALDFDHRYYSFTNVSFDESFYVIGLSSGNYYVYKLTYNSGSNNFNYAGSSSYVSLDSVLSAYENKESLTYNTSSARINYYDLGYIVLFNSNVSFTPTWYSVPEDYYVIGFDPVDGDESLLAGILSAIISPFKKIGQSIINFVKTGFVQLFVQEEVVDTVVVYHASPIAWFTFALMGIALAMSLTYFVVNLLRRSK